MNISIYNYNKRENTFLYEKTTSNNLTTLNQIHHLANKPLKIVEYVIKKHKEKKKKTSSKTPPTTKFKLTTLNNLARKRQKDKQMLKQMHNHHHSHNKQQNRFNNNNNNNTHVNRHFQHQQQQQQQQQQHQFMQPIPQPTMSSYQSYFGSTNMNMNQQQSLFQFNSNPNPFQSNANTFRQRTSFNTKSLKSKSIKIGRATTHTNTSNNINNQFKFQPSSSTTSMPVSNLSSSNETFTNIMSASFGVNPGVAQAAAAACATLAQLLRSELTINLANDQPRLVISGSRPSTQQQQQQNNLNCNNKRKPSKYFPYYNNNNNSNNSNKDQFNSNLKSKSNRFKHFKSGNLNTNLVSTPAATTTTTATTSLPQTIVVKNKTAPYNTTQYIMHDYTKRRSLKDQVCPSDDFSQDWNKALEAAAHEATCSGADASSSSSSSAVVDSTTHFNFNFLNFKSSKLVESGLVDILGCRDESGSQQQPSSTTNDESNLAEIGRKLSRSFSNLCPIVTPSSSSTNIECIEMKDENDDDAVEDSSTAALFSSSI